jgi:o-succinylbenzoate---CoA ligase
VRIRIQDKAYAPGLLRKLKAEEIKLTKEKDALLFLHQWFSGKLQFRMHTSGSTGFPKEIMLTREQMIQSASASTDFLDLKRFQSCLLALPASYIAGKMLLVRALVNGMDVDVIHPSLNVLAELDQKHSYELSSFVPSQLDSILQHERAVHALQQFKLVLVGGAPLSKRLEKALHQMQHVELWQTYGMTETVSHIALRRINGPQASDLYDPLPRVELRIDERGCLCIRWSVTGPDWIVTNDLAEMEGRGFRLLGRIDEVINSGAVKIHPQTDEPLVEDLLLEMNIRRPFFIGSVADEKLGQKAILVMEGEPLTDELQQQLLDRMKKDMPPYHAPSAIYYLPAFHLTASGKPDKSKMLASFLKD